MLTHISLFSGGIDGIGIAAEWAGFKTIIQCEINEYCQMVLKKNNPDALLHKDVTQVFKLPKANLLSAGIPCQEHASVNKKGSGSNFEWSHTIRLVRQSKPNWVVIENVNGILNTIHEEICTDLETSGYEVQTFNIPAYTVGAHHERYRVFIVGNSDSEPVTQTNQAIMSCGEERNPWENITRSTWGSLPGTYWGTHKPPVCGVVNGLAERFYKDRVKAIGNAVVPQQIYPILKCIAEIELKFSA
jgi:DNA (cytosine-5)-methyltransferase 1